MNRYKQGLSEELPDIKVNTLQTNFHVQQLTEWTKWYLPKKIHIVVAKVQQKKRQNIVGRNETWKVCPSRVPRWGFPYDGSRVCILRAPCELRNLTWNGSTN